MLAANPMQCIAKTLCMCSEGGFSGHLFCVHQCQDLSRLVDTGFGMTRYLHAC